MVTLAINYLPGWAMATDPSNRMGAEWPPHPDRVFMALVGSYFETDGTPTEYAALEWIERAGPPGIRCSPHHERTVTTSFVPVNDTRVRSAHATAKQGLPLLPEYRTRQPRQFPVAIPHDPVVRVIWPTRPSPDALDGLASLCEKVVRIGHSSSMVQMWVEDDDATPNLIPSSRMNSIRMRVPGPGRLTNLQRQFANGRRPEPALWVGYGKPDDESETESVSGTIFDDQMLVLKQVDGHSLPLESTLAVTGAVRNALLSRCADPVPEWLSGHDVDGSPSRDAHVAILPMPFVSHEYADGHLLGVGLAIPGHVTADEVLRVFNPVIGYQNGGSLHRLHVHTSSLNWTLEMETRDTPPNSLRNRTWTRASRRWATVTPIAFERHVKKNRGESVEGMVADACRFIGLPAPATVAVGPVSEHSGVPHGRRFPAMRRKRDNGSINHVHATLVFSEPVQGPIVLGNGRFRGYGLCKPLPDEKETES